VGSGNLAELGKSLRKDIAEVCFSSYVLPVRVYLPALSNAFADRPGDARHVVRATLL
jgi:hypothetical protein